MTGDLVSAGKWAEAAFTPAIPNPVETAVFIKFLLSIIASLR